MSLRMKVVWRVLEAAKDAGDATVVAACRKLIALDRVARWDAGAWQTVRALA